MPLVALCSAPSANAMRGRAQTVRNGKTSQKSGSGTNVRIFLYCVRLRLRCGGGGTPAGDPGLASNCGPLISRW